MKLLLIKEYNPLIILEERYILKKENYLSAIDYPVKTIGELYTASQEDSKNRSASNGDIIQLNTGSLFIIALVGYRKVKWGDVINFTVANNN
ncbi:hypothetical protein ACJVDH_15345 [Pedobacter sp. AW1-32]|uniref:hypothetical protein n=1 Tax=Pedobacter sp. AW1-32 TaxID=3383026 RepID=UPI003FED75C0